MACLPCYVMVCIIAGLDVQLRIVRVGVIENDLNIFDLRVIRQDPVVYHDVVVEGKADMPHLPFYLQPFEGFKRVYSLHCLVGGLCHGMHEIVIKASDVGLGKLLIQVFFHVQFFAHQPGRQLVR